MAQQLSITKNGDSNKITIDDNELVVFEFEEFFNKLSHEFNFVIDTYSGGIVRFEKKPENSALNFYSNL